MGKLAFESHLSYHRHGCLTQAVSKQSKTFSRPQLWKRKMVDEILTHQVPADKEHLNNFEWVFCHVSVWIIFKRFENNHLINRKNSLDLPSRLLSYDNVNNTKKKISLQIHVFKLFQKNSAKKSQQRRNHNIQFQFQLIRKIKKFTKPNLWKNFHKT